MRKWKEELLEQRRKMMEEKLLHAEFKRELQLQAIVKKAQEEEAKVKKGILNIYTRVSRKFTDFLFRSVYSCGIYFPSTGE